MSRCVMSGSGHKKPWSQKQLTRLIQVEYGLFTCYDFSVLDSDRRVAALSPAYFC
jgi:hypothetical protein